MRCKNDKPAGMILAVILCLFGIFFENHDVNVLFSSAAVKANDSHIQSVYPAVSDTQVWTAEMPVLRSTCGIKQSEGRFIGQTRGWNLSLGFWCPDNYLLQRRIFSSSECTHDSRPCFSELVTNYIHNSDGKKRI